jgi:hypothetical protein
MKYMYGNWFLQPCLWLNQFFLQILRLEKKPWRKTMGKEAWKKAKAPEVELSGSLAWT